MRSCKRAGRSWSRVGCGRSCDEDAKHRDIPRVYVAADCAVLEQRSCRSDTDTEMETCALITPSASVIDVHGAHP